MRFWWADSRGHGHIDLYVNFGGQINRHTTIAASIHELTQPEGQPLDFPHMGAATMSIANIVPRDDGIAVLRVHVDWDNDLYYRIRFITD